MMSRKFIVSLVAVGCITLLGLTGHPEVATWIAGVAVGFFGAHAAQDWGKKG